MKHKRTGLFWMFLGSGVTVSGFFAYVALRHTLTNGR